VFQGHGILEHDTLAKQGVEVKMDKGRADLESINIECEDVELAKQCFGVIQLDM
jgi:hypothetical protein